MIVVYPWYIALKEQGFEGNTPREVLHEALKIGTVLACETALNAVIGSVGVAFRSNENKAEVMKGIMRTPDFKAVVLYRKQLMHEAI